MKYYIYMTTFPSGRFYIGKHQYKGDGIAKDYVGSGVCVSAFKKANKNWRELLKCEILEYCSKELLDIREQWWITWAKSIFGDFREQKDSMCLNWADDANPPIMYGEDNFMYQNHSFSGENNPMYGDHRNAGENNPMYGRDWRDGKTAEELAEISAKLSAAKSGENNPMYGDHRFAGENNPRYGHSPWEGKSQEEMLDIKRKISERTKEGCKNRVYIKYVFVDSNGEKHVMDIQNKKRWHPDWTLLGPYVEQDNNKDNG